MTNKLFSLVAGAALLALAGTANAGQPLSNAQMDGVTAGGTAIANAASITFGEVLSDTASQTSTNVVAGTGIPTLTRVAVAQSFSQGLAAGWLLVPRTLPISRRHRGFSAIIAATCFAKPLPSKGETNMKSVLYGLAALPFLAGVGRQDSQCSSMTSRWTASLPALRITLSRSPTRVGSRYAVTPTRGAVR